MNSKQAYVLSKKYTEETVEQFGYVKGANCKISSIVHENGQNIVTFEWKNDSDETRTTTMTVDDGTPIYVYEEGTSYEYGDLVIYQSAFYRCTVETSSTTFNQDEWQEIGSADGNYDIVADSSYLPTRFTESDKKMYYAYDEDIFYFWDGTEWLEKFVVDDTLSDTSTNPVQNKVIKEELDSIQDLAYLDVDEDTLVLVCSL